MAAVYLLSWLLCLSVWLIPSDSYTLDGVKVHEVVRLIRLHDLDKRDLEPTRPESIKYALTLGGKDIELHLERSSDFITEAYTETHYHDDGTPVTTKPKELDLCYYHGKIANDSESTISVSTCDGLRGFIQTAEQRFLIEPTPQNGDGHHALLKYEDVVTTPSVCGVTNTTWQPMPDGIPPRKPKSRTSGLTMFQQKKYNELYIVADKQMYLKMDSDIEKVRKRIYDIVNFLNAVYKPLNLFIALVGLEVWTDSNKISVTEPAGATLTNFTKWRNDVLMKRQKHDNAHLITGFDLEGTTVGLSYIGSFCSDYSTAIIQDHNPRAIAVGATLAHEMGHNLGMNHDTSACTCNGPICIMTAFLSKTIPQFFSNCSMEMLEQYLNMRDPVCLLNKPEPQVLLQPAVCGNGFREDGEECDCGTVAECTNPCCNATTCTLKKGSQCADGECCFNCKIADSRQICRPKVDECDLPEYCTGTSNTCPGDVFALNGLPCKNGKGYCYNGQCPQRQDQCVKMWGPNAVVANTTCYRLNTMGTTYAYCVRLTDNQFVRCLKENVMCGKLFCEKGQTTPNYGRSVTIGSCKATFYSKLSGDLGQVDHGTKCDEGKVCKDYKCVSLEAAYQLTNCSAKCSGHGVCNNKLECTCDPGWLLPFCKMPATRSAATSSNSGLSSSKEVTTHSCSEQARIEDVYLYYNH